MNRPKSASHPLSLIVGFLTFLILLFYQKGRWEMNIPDRSLVLILGTTLALSLCELFVFKIHRFESTGLQWAQFHPSLKRVFIKFVGLCATFAAFAFLYWIFPEYEGDFYRSYFTSLQNYLLPVLGVSFVYILFVDGWMKDPEDAYFHLGQITLLNFEKADTSVFKAHFLGWTIKAFFLPLMFTYLCNDIARFNANTDFLKGDFLSWYRDLYDLSFLIDVGVVSMGYLFSLRLLDTHIRSSEPTVKGWVVALICYEPFWSLVGGQYLRYGSSFQWSSWLKDFPVLLMIWGSLILLCQVVYGWASIQFGLRFSNLTHRGIITNGPYRWSKHPAYIAKNLSYWLISMPLVTSSSMAEALQRVALLLGVNYLYYLRAKTEEEHLSLDPHYRDYVVWIRENGWLSRWTSKA